MGRKVVSIEFSTPLEEVLSLLDTNAEVGYVHVNHREVGKEGESLINIARNNKAAKLLLVGLANRGFLTYVVRDSVTSLVHLSELPRLWIPIKEGEYSYSKKGVVYTYTPPVRGGAANKLLVIFSQIADKPHSASLNRHFMKNFPTLQKYIPSDTGVLRVADMGGVIGAYYMNTIALPENEDVLQEFLSGFIYDNKINKNNVVFYGASKGGSGALYHSVLGQYKAVAVDPVLSDDHYLKQHNDFHFIEGVFEEDRERRISNLVKAVGLSAPRISIVTSDRSAQYHYIKKILEPILPKISIFNSVDKKIKLHPDVGPNTIPLTVMLINMHLYGIEVPRGYQVVN